MGATPIQLLDTRDDGFAAAFARLEQRRSHEQAAIETRVAAILEDVRTRGDDAVVEAVERYDGVAIRKDELVWESDAIEKGASGLDPALTESLGNAAERIRAFHSHRVPAARASVYVRWSRSRSTRPPPRRSWLRPFSCWRCRPRSQAWAS